MPVPPTSYGSQHPLASTSEARQKAMAMAMLRRKLPKLPKAVWRIDVDRIAFVDSDGRAQTAFLEARGPTYWVIAGFADGWPVEA